MAFVHEVLSQRRFGVLLASLLGLALLIGVLIVPLEQGHEGAVLLHWFDGLWWAMQTITSVGYGDYVPVTVLGKVVGMALQLIGVVMFGLLIAIISLQLETGKRRFLWQRLFERLDHLEKKLEQSGKREEFVVEQMSERHE